MYIYIHIYTYIGNNNIVFTLCVAWHIYVIAYVYSCSICHLISIEPLDILDIIYHEVNIEYGMCVRYILYLLHDI